MKTNKTTVKSTINPTLTVAPSTTPTVAPSTTLKMDLPKNYFGKILVADNDTCAVYLDPEKRKEYAVYSINHINDTLVLYQVIISKMKDVMTINDADGELKHYTKMELSRRKTISELLEKLLFHSNNTTELVRSVREKAIAAVKEAWQCGKLLNEICHKMLNDEWHTYCKLHIPLNMQTIKRYMALANRCYLEKDLMTVRSLTDAYKKCGIIKVNGSIKSTEDEDKEINQTTIELDPGKEKKEPDKETNKENTKQPNTSEFAFDIGNNENTNVIDWQRIKNASEYLQSAYEIIKFFNNQSELDIAIKKYNELIFPLIDMMVIRKETQEAA